MDHLKYACHLWLKYAVITLHLILIVLLLDYNSLLDKDEGGDTKDLGKIMTDP